MANLRRVSPSKNVEDRRGRVYPSKRVRREQAYRDYTNYQESKGLTHGPDQVDRVVEQKDKSRRLQSENRDRQSDVKTLTAGIRRQISKDYQNFLSPKKR